MEGAGSPNVTLADVALRLVVYTREIFGRLIASAKKKDDERKKRLLLTYLNKTRQRFIALLAVAKWSEGKNDIVARVTALNHELSTIQWQMDQPPTKLFFIHNFVRDQVRAPMFDVATAAELLCQGTYNQPPASIFPPELDFFLNSDEADESKSYLEDGSVAMASLEHSVWCALFDSNVPEGFSVVTVEGGCAVLGRKDEFCVRAVPLLKPPQTKQDDGTWMDSATGSKPEEIKWAIVSVELFVRSRGSVSVDKDDTRLESLRRMCQRECVTGGLQAVLILMEKVSSQLQLALMLEQAKSVRDALSVSIAEKQEKDALLVSFWNGVGNMEIRLVDTRLVVKLDGEEATGLLNPSSLDLSLVVSSAIAHSSQRILREIASCCPQSTRWKLVAEDEGVSLWLFFTTDDRWCRVVVEATSGALKLQFCRALDEGGPESVAFSSKITGLFSSTRFADRVRGHRLLQCRSLVQSAVSRLPVGMMSLLTHVTGVPDAFKANGFFMVYNFSKSFLVVVEIVHPHDDPKVSLLQESKDRKFALKDSWMLSETVPLEKKRRVEGGESSPQMERLSAFLAETLFRKVCLESLIIQIRNAKMEVEARDESSVVVTAASCLSNCFERRFTVHLDANGRWKAQLVSIVQFDSILDETSKSMRLFSTTGTCPIQMTETSRLEYEGRRVFSWGSTKIVEGTFSHFLDDIRSFATSVTVACDLSNFFSHAEKLAELRTYYPIFGFQPTFSGVWVFFGKQPGQCFSFKMEHSHGSNATRFTFPKTVREEGRCLPHLQDLCEPFSSDLLATLHPIVAIQRVMEATPVVDAIRSWTIRLQNEEKLPYTGDVVLLARKLNQFVLRFGSLFGVHIICVPDSRVVVLADAHDRVCAQAKIGPRYPLCEWSTFWSKILKERYCTKRIDSPQTIIARNSNSYIELNSGSVMVDAFDDELVPLLFRFMGVGQLWLHAGEAAKHYKLMCQPIAGVPLGDAKWRFESKWSLVTELAWNWTRMALDCTVSFNGWSPQRCSFFASLINQHKSLRFSFQALRAFLSLCSARPACIALIMDAIQDLPVELLLEVPTEGLPEHQTPGMPAYPKPGMPALLVDQQAGFVNLIMRVRSSNRLVPLLVQESTYELWAPNPSGDLVAAATRNKGALKDFLREISTVK